MATRAFRRGGESCLLAAHLEMCGSTTAATRLVHVVDDAYPYPCGSYRTAPKISIPDYIETGNSHNPTSSRPNGNSAGKLWVYASVSCRVGKRLFCVLSPQSGELCTMFISGSLESA